MPIRFGIYNRILGDTGVPGEGASTRYVTVSAEVWDWQAWQREYDNSTLRAPLSGTFLQTLLDLVTPLKGHSLSPRSCPATRSAPSERFGYYEYDCGSSLAPKHARKHQAHPLKKEFRLDSNNSGFIWAGVSNVVSYKTNVWYNLSCL